MKLRTILKIATVTSVILLCIGLAVFFYFRIEKAEKLEDFNLYTIVPPSAEVIVDSDNIVELLKGINELHCSKEGHFLVTSRLFSQLKDHINTLVSETPHGFSRQMSKMLISFHEPDNDKNQVFYCRLGVGDKDVVDGFIKKYCETSFPSKYFDYKGEEIRIYSMPDDSFLAFYMTPDFMAVSYQKRLIEEVIDSRLSKKSILKVPGFPPVETKIRAQLPAVVHIKMQPLYMGLDSLRANVGGWTTFNMKMNHDAIYFAGVNHIPDTAVTFMNTLRAQQPVEDFPGDMLPATTFQLSRTSLTDIAKLIEFAKAHAQPQRRQLGNVAKTDAQLWDFMREYAGNSVTTCMFHSSDTIYNEPHTLLNVPIRNMVEARRQMRSILSAYRSSYPNSLPRRQIYRTSGGVYRINAVPQNTILSYFTGIANPPGTYMCFYKDNMLMAEDADCIKSYIDAMESGQTLDENMYYNESRRNLSDHYNYLYMTDMGQLMSQPGQYLSSLPNYFLRNSDFFKHFTLSAQFTYLDSVMYPNVVLLYKGIIPEVEEIVSSDSVGTDSIRFVQQ